MEPAQTFYNQPATHFKLPLYLRGATEVDGRLIAELAESLLTRLLFPGTRVTALSTKRAGMGAKLNMGDFSSARWKGAQKKLLSGEYAAVQIEAETPDFPHQKIWFSSHVNPPGGAEHLGAGTIALQCSVSYLRHVAASPEKVEALLQIAKQAWNGVAGGPAYGYGHLAATRERFWRLDAALQPAFLSRAETPDLKRGLLGYFYRERPVR